MVFAAPLPYCRNQGFRTAKTTIPFKVLAALSDDENEMADLRGESSNHFDGLFAEFEEWEAILRLFDEFPVEHPENLLALMID